MEEEGKPEPKLSEVEIILITLFSVSLDLIGLFLLFFALPDFWIGSIFGTFSTIYLVWFKKLPPTRQIVAWLLKWVPWLGSLPLLTIGFWLTVYLDRHPKLAKVAQMASGKVGQAGKAAEGASKEVGGEVARRRGGLPQAPEKEPTRGYQPSYEAEPAYAGEEEIKEPVAVAEPAKAGVSEEEFGVEKEPIEKLVDITRKLPEDLDEEYRKAA